MAVYERVERPGWFERLLVVGICAGLLVALAIVDERAARREAARAQVVLAERAQHAAERSNREAMTAPRAAPDTRTEGVGRDAPIVVAAGPGVGHPTSVFSPADEPDEADTAAPAPETVLRRVQGPTPSDAGSAIPEPATPPRLQAEPVPAVPPTPPTSPSRNDAPLVLMLMAALGLSMAGGGLRLVSRRSA